MDALELTTLSLSAILAGFSPSSSESPRVTTHMLPVISGQWEIDLEFPHNSLTIEENELSSTDNYIVQEDIAEVQNTYTLDEGEANNNLSISLDTESGKIKNKAISGSEPSSKAENNENHIGKQCRELYNFDADSKVNVSSGKELTRGRYLVSYQEEGLPIIAMTTTYDNNEIDCSGAQIDQSGQTMIAYLDYQGSFMKWCNDNEGTECYAYFNRIYP